MNKLTHYRRGGGNWITVPNLTHSSVVLFLLLGTFSELRVEDEDGNARIISKGTEYNEREKLLSALA